VILSGEHPGDVSLRHVWLGGLPRPNAQRLPPRGEAGNIIKVELVRAEQFMEVFVIGTEQDQRRAREQSDAVHLLGGPPPLPATSPVR
jgi:hypothetical protein